MKQHRSVTGTALRLGRRLRKVLSSRAGGFDLPSVMTAVLVSVILTGAGLVLAVGVMPWSQDNIAKDALGPIRTAEQTAKSTTRAFLDKTDLLARKAITPADSVDVGVDADGNCYVAVAKSDSGKVFYVTNTEAEARELPQSGEAGCLPAASVRALSDSVGGVETSAASKAAFRINYPDSIFSATSATAESISPAVTGTSGTLTYSYSGTLPDGVTFSTTTGKFTGSVWGGGAQTVSAGYGFSCGLSDKTAYCWGSNTDGKLGNGDATLAPSNVPVPVGGLLTGKSVTAVSAGIDTACAIADGAAYCWGRNTSGQLGNGSITNSSVPVKVFSTGVLAGKTITSISTAQRSTCAVADGAAYCWGDPVNGLRGDGATAGAVATKPVEVTATGELKDRTVTDITVGNDHACAIANGRVFCWGLNNSGQLGDGTTTSSPVPVAVTGLLLNKAVTSLSAGGDSSDSSTCAVAAAKAYCWGANSSGQLGDNTTVAKSIPVAVNTAAGSGLAGLSVTSIAASYFHTCAVAGTGAGPAHAYCWGSGSDGRLGNGTLTSSLIPVSAGLDTETVTAITTGRFHSCGIASGGAVCWGNNGPEGALGNGSAADSSRPVGVKTLGSTSGFPAEIQVSMTNGTESDTTQVKLELR